MHVKEANRKVQTTVRLPRPLYQKAKWFVDEQCSDIETINDFFVAAVAAYLKMLERKRIDAAICGMSEDTDYQKEALLIAEEFVESDWEALEITEKDPIEV